VRTGKKNRVLYQLKMTLRDVHPPIWRRIQVWEDTTLAQLHRILQIVMGWENSHLHEFRIGHRVYSVPDPDDDLNERTIIDERRQRLRQVVPQVGRSSTRMTSGDNSRHELLLEAIACPRRNRQIWVEWPTQAPKQGLSWPFSGLKLPWWWLPLL
jgi:hypothetical protein